MLNKILSKIQADLKAPKGQFNNFGKYKYRNCEDIVEAVKPLLHKENVALLMSDEVVQIGSRIYVKATATILHGEASISVTAYAREAEDKKGMDDSQITGAASSYARKYALNGLFAIDDTKDADSATEAVFKKESTKDKGLLKQAHKEEPSGFSPHSDERNEWGEPPSKKSDEIPESPRIVFLTFDELREKILATTAIPHLKNVWVKHKAEIEALSKDETKRLTAVKDAKKKELTGGGENSAEGRNEQE